jgi:adenylate cyclase
MSEVNLFERRPEDAIEWARKSLRQPNTQTSRWVLIASSLAQAGQTDEAHQAVESLLRLTPGYTIATARDIWRLADAATKEYVLDGLRKAGLPEN